MKDFENISFKNNGKLKLLIIIGTRPEIIRLSAVITKCRKYFDCILAHTGQNYDYNLNGVFFHDLKLDDPDVYMDAVGDDLGATIGNIINYSYKLMQKIKPDALLILGDTNSCLSAIPAKRLHIGSPMAEVLRANLAEIEKSNVLEKLDVQSGKYILLSAHREENIDTEKNFLSLFSAINELAAMYDMPILYSCHPRSRERLKKSGFVLDSRVRCHEPFGFHDYNKLQLNAFAVVSDSGTLPEESSFFTSIGKPFPAVCIRTSTERPEALEKGCFVLAGIDKTELLRAVKLAVEMNENSDFGTPVADYTDENVSGRVVKIIQSYTGIVDKMVWRKS